MKHIKSKKSRGLVTKSIAYKSNKHPHDRSRELKVDVPLATANQDCHLLLPGSSFIQCLFFSQCFVNTNS